MIIDEQQNEAEAAVIGALLLKPDLYPKAAGIISGNDFSNRFDRIVYETIGEDYATTGKIDPVILLERICAKDAKYSRTHVREYFVSVARGVPVVEHLDAYCSIIRDKSRARQAKAVLSEAIETPLYNATQTADGIQEIAERLAALARDKNKRQARNWQEILHDLENRLFGDYEDESIPTGFGTLDALLDGIEPGDVVVIGGGTGTGKTAFMLQILKNIAKRGIKPLLYSQEMTDVQNAVRVLARQTGIKMNKLRRQGRLNEDEIKRVMRAFEELRKLDIIIQDTGGVTVEEIRLDCVSMKDRDVIFVDHIGLMGCPKELKRAGITEITTHNMKELKALAQDIKKPIVVLSQFARDGYKNGAVPDLNSFKDSGEVENSATSAIVLWRMIDYEGSGMIGVKLVKNRQGESGGTMYMRFDAQLMQFLEVDNYIPPKIAKTKKYEERLFQE